MSLGDSIDSFARVVIVILLKKRSKITTNERDIISLQFNRVQQENKF